MIARRDFKKTDDDDEENHLLQSQSSGISARVAVYKNENVDNVSPPTYTFLYALLSFLVFLCVGLAFILLSSSSEPLPPPISDSSSLLSIPPSPPDWVLQHRVDHLFHFTWYRTNNYSSYLSYMSSPHQPAPISPPPPPSSSPPPAVVNEVVSYLYSHPSEGVIVDFSPQLPNPSPHPLPLARDFHETCKKLHLENEWATCKRPQAELNDWLPATTHVVTIGVFDAFIDTGSCNGAVPGTPFTPSATYHLQRWTNNPCYNDPIDLNKVERGAVKHYSELVDTIGTYLSATGHFAPQQLPRLIRSLAVCPKSAKVLVAAGGIADVLIDVLIERGIVERKRIVRYEGGGLYHAHVVYRTDTWPYLTDKYNHYAHDRTDMQLVHRVMVDDLPDAQRDLVILIKRGEGAARRLKDQTKLLNHLTDSLSQHSALGLRAVEWDAKGHVRDHIEMFKRAKVIIGPHGAGMLNLYWLKPGSHVVEIGYDSGMTFPEMYAEMAMHSDHYYWVVQGKGDYDGEIELNYEDFDWSWGEILKSLQSRTKTKDK